VDGSAARCRRATLLAVLGGGLAVATQYPITR
jgi:hypothetical protein